jgi:hypothetical protein
MEKSEMTILLNKNQLFALMVALMCLILLTASNALTEDTVSCADEIEKFCKDVEPGGGRIAKCLAEHKNDLSPSCQERTKEVRKKMRGIHEACQDDVQKFCYDVQPGEGRIAKCLKEHKSEMSSECKEELARPRKKR